MARAILEALPEWFGIQDAREEYVEQSVQGEFLCAYDGNTPKGNPAGGNRPVGFLCLRETGDATVELYVMGVLKERHRQGVGRALFQHAREIAAERGYSFMQVKTVQSGRYAEYDGTNAFYRSLGFREFEVFPTLWDAWNPCQVYVMAIG